MTGDNGKDTEKAKGTSIVKIAIAVIPNVIAILLLFWIEDSHSQRHPDDNTLYLMIFFALPNCLYPICFWLSRESLCKDDNGKCYLWYIFIYLALPCLTIIIPWHWYLNASSSKWQSNGAIYCVGISVILLLLSALPSWLIMKPGTAFSGPTFPQQLLKSLQCYISSEIKSQPISLIVEFIIILILIIDVSAFAFAFHDKELSMTTDAKEPVGLFMKEFQVQPPKKDQANTGGGESNSGGQHFLSGQQAKDPSSPALEKGDTANKSVLPPTSGYWRLYFAVNQSDLECLDGYYDGYSKAQAKKKYLGDLKDSDEKNFPYKWHNKKTIEEILEFIIARRQTEPPLPRITLTCYGHASQEVGNNFILSSQRAISVQNKLFSLLNENLNPSQYGMPGIVPCWDKDEFHKPDFAVEDPDMKAIIDDKNRSFYCVEILATVNTIPMEESIARIANTLDINGLLDLKETPDPESQKEPPKPLSLLEYIYFTTYTITTTGYGDIQPRTQFTKFFTSVLNIYEVILLIIVINVFFTYSNRDKLPNNENDNNDKSANTEGIPKPNPPGGDQKEGEEAAK